MTGIKTTGSNFKIMLEDQVDYRVIIVALDNSKAFDTIDNSFWLYISNENDFVLIGSVGQNFNVRHRSLNKWLCGCHDSPNSS